MSDESESRVRRRVGIKDIAGVAKVSTAAVSYALNGTGRLDVATRERILAIARELGYRADPNARNLRRRTAGVLAVAASVPAGLSDALPGMDYFMTIWQAATAAALKRGYMLLLLPFGTDPAALAGHRVDGGIVIDPVADDPLVRRLRLLGVPAVTIGRDVVRAADGDVVDNDHAALTRLALDHLAHHGARRVAAILSDPAYGFTHAVREAYEGWCTGRGTAPRIATVNAAATESAGYEAALGLLGGEEPPDAIFAALDRFAVGALFAASTLGRGVPHDVRIVSGNDGVATRTAAVPITALDLSPGELGRAAVNMLIDRVEGATERRTEVVPGRLMVRASSVSP